jgi:hypothetical protein
MGIKNEENAHGAFLSGLTGPSNVIAANHNGDLTSAAVLLREPPGFTKNRDFLGVWSSALLCSQHR